MTVHVRQRHHFAHSIERLLQAIGDPDFHDAKVRHVGEPGSKLVEFERADDERLRIVTRQVIDRDDLPGVARRFSRGRVHADRIEDWELNPIWSSGEIDVDVPGAPMRSGGRISLLSDGDDACTMTVKLSISVSAPLVARGLERGMAENVRDWLEDEQEFTRRWLADGGR